MRGVRAGILAAGTLVAVAIALLLANLAGPEGKRVERPSTLLVPSGAVGPELPEKKAPELTAKEAERVIAVLRRKTGMEPASAWIEETARVAQSIRESALADLERSAVTAAERVAARITAMRYLMETSAADLNQEGLLELLRRLPDSPAHAVPLLEKAEAYHALFRHRIRGPIVDGPGLAPKWIIPDGATISFPAGQYAWTNWSLHRRDEFPADLVIAGASPGDTLLSMRGMRTNDEVRNLNLRELTIYCDHNHLLDMKSENPVTIYMERVRVVGFDFGAGSSSMISGRRVAVLAGFCVFEAGFGRSPGSGNVFSVGEAALVRCYKCVFRGPFQSVFEAGDSKTYVFLRCSFLDMPTWTRAQFERPPEGVRFHGCKFTYIDDGRERFQKSIAELNPSWKDQ